LTPALLAEWLGEAAPGAKIPQPPRFWVRLLSHLEPSIPGWPDGQNLGSPLHGPLKVIAEATEVLLREGTHRATLKDVYTRLRGRREVGNLTVGDFLDALSGARTVTIHWAKPDQPEVQLRKLRLDDVVRAVLQASSVPLGVNEILDRAEGVFGRDLVRWDPRTLSNALTPQNGFYKLGPKTYGLRSHLRLPQREWRSLRKEACSVLAVAQGSMSTFEILEKLETGWAGRLDAYELAQVLREDDRFEDLGRLVFALSKPAIKPARP
jgi:hypothetical protein